MQEIDGGPIPRWEPRARAEDAEVETLALREGFSVVLSRFDPGPPRSFVFREPDDLFGLGFHLREGATFCLEGTSFRTQAADIWACAQPRGSTCRFELPAAGFATVSLRFDPVVALEYLDGAACLPRRVRGMLERAAEKTEATRLAPLTTADTLCLRAMFETGYGAAARRLFLESCALDLLARRIGGSDSPTSSPSLRARDRERAVAARDYLDQHFRAPPTTARLARIVGVNECTLKRAFKEAFGTTLFAHVTRRRMERAAELLGQGMSVSMAAREVGYECVRSFSAAFHRQVGRRPSEYRHAAGHRIPDRRRSFSH